MKWEALERKYNQKSSEVALAVKKETLLRRIWMILMTKGHGMITCLENRTNAIKQTNKLAKLFWGQGAPIGAAATTRMAGCKRNSPCDVRLCPLQVVMFLLSTLHHGKCNKLNSCLSTPSTNNQTSNVAWVGKEHPMVQLQLWEWLVAREIVTTTEG